MIRTTTRRGQHRAKAPRDPFEPIVAARLRLALTAADLTESEAARRAGISQPAVNTYLQSTRTHCRHSTLVKLAHLLGVNPKWLAGGSLNPLTPQAQRAMDRAIFERAGRDDESPAAYQSWLDSLNEKPPGEVLTVMRFGARVLERLQRDPAPAGGDGVQAAQERPAVMWQLVDLLDVRHWRGRVLHTEGTCEGGDVEAGTRALAKAFELVLAPWLDDRSSTVHLDRPALAALALRAHTQETP